MSLTIGELTGVVSIDDSSVDPALSRVEIGFRTTGEAIAAEAARAGEEAGTDLGEGVADGAEEGGEEATSRIKSGLLKLGAGLATIGLAAGGALMEGIAGAMEQGKVVGKLAAQLDATPAEAQKYGHIAGQLYANAVTEDFEGAADAISATMRAGLLPPTATNAQIQSIATNVSDLASTFDLDLGQTANAVGQMMKTGLAPNAKVALDTITKGLQDMGPRADDIADTFNEYSTIFRNMGLDATTATGLLSQGMKAGARDTDVVADSLKEFTVITQGGGKQVDAAFKTIGLNGKTMQKVFTQGGPPARDALDKVLDGLRNMKDPAKRNTTALALFGTKTEDMQKALLALDPSKATASLGKVGGSADEMGNKLRDNAGVQVEQFKRKMQQGLVDFAGTKVIPLLQKMPGYIKNVGDAFVTAAGFIKDNQTAFIVVGSIITTIVLPSLVAMAVTAVTSTATAIAAWVSQAAAAVATGATYVGVNALIIAGWISTAAGAVASAATVVASWVLMGVQSMIRAAQMAAAWVIALGPVGWITAAIIGLVVLVIANWDTIKNKTVEIWNAVVDWIKGAVSAVIDWVKQYWPLLLGILTGPIGLAVGLIIQHWDTIKTKTNEAWQWIKDKVTGFLTGIKNSVMSILTGIRDYITGKWTEIKNSTSNLWSSISSTVSSWMTTAKNAVSNAISNIKTYFTDGFNQAKTTVSNAIRDAINVMNTIDDKAKAALAGAGTWLLNSGKALIQGLIDGIKSKIGDVTGAVKGVMSKARDLLPFSPAKTGPFAGKGWSLYSGRSIMEALTTGVKQRSGAFVGSVKDAMTQAQSHQMAMPMTAYAGATAGTSVAASTQFGQNAGGGGTTLSIQHYYESEGGNARSTATELEWLARVRG